MMENGLVVPVTLIVKGSGIADQLARWSWGRSETGGYMRAEGRNGVRLQEVTAGSKNRLNLL